MSLTTTFNTTEPAILVVGGGLDRAADNVFEELLGWAGIRKADICTAFGKIEDDPAAPRRIADALKPNIVVTLGSKAAWAMVPGWPGDSIQKAKGILDRRGFFWMVDGQKILTAVHPSSFLTHGQVMGINAKIQHALLGRDLKRAKEESTSAASPFEEIKVTVVTTLQEATNAVADLRNYKEVACDIEIRDERRLACIGFAGDRNHAYVFTEPVFARAIQFLEGWNTPRFVFQNGTFDLYFLRSVCNLRSIPNYADDTIVQFHTAWPEFAGSSEGIKAKKRAKRTQKGLHFLASLYDKVEWWKDYEFDNDQEMYDLNGIDCCVTLRCHQALKEEHKRFDIDPELYWQEVHLMHASASILERGIRIDEERRKKCLGQLRERIASVTEDLEKLVNPHVQASRDSLSHPDLFWKTVTCTCCRNGNTKRDHCWKCLGYEGSPSKKELEKRFGNPDGLSKGELYESKVGPCEVCGGRGQWEEFHFNPRSNAQKHQVLFEALKIPKRYSKGKVTADEAKLKDLRASLKGDKLAVVDNFLALAKLETMRRVYARMAPGPDGKLRTWLSPVGTDTGRLSSSATFLIRSTNLQNLPKKTARLDPLYNVRQIFIPDDEHMFVEGDYAQIEARLTAAFADDVRALEAFDRGEDIHRKTASQIFGVAPEEVSWEQRHLGKMSRHALNYGMGWRKFLEAINSDADLTGVSITAAEAKRIHGAYRELSPAVVEWWDKVWQEVQETGCLTNAYGRKRMFVDRSESARNAIIAYLPQSTAADHVNRALLRAESQGLKVLLQIHDALLIQVPALDMRHTARQLKECMERYPVRIGKHQVHIPVDLSTSASSWGGMQGV